jgi:hypothetical protein
MKMLCFVFFFFVIQDRQCRNDKMSLRNDEAKQRQRQKEEKKREEKSSLILIDAELSTA